MPQHPDWSFGSRAVLAFWPHVCREFVGVLKRATRADLLPHHRARPAIDAEAVDHEVTGHHCRGELRILCRPLDLDELADLRANLAAVGDNRERATRSC